MAANGYKHSGAHLFVGTGWRDSSRQADKLGAVQGAPRGWRLEPCSSSGLPQAPEVRAIVPHPSRHRTVYAGTQDGPYVSEDCGDSWTRVPGVESGLPVWSILFDPRDPMTMYTGGEDAQVHASADGGETWTCLSTEMRFPEIMNEAGGESREDGS